MSSLSCVHFLRVDVGPAAGRVRPVRSQEVVDVRPARVADRRTATFPVPADGGRMAGLQAFSCSSLLYTR